MQALLNSTRVNEWRIQVLVMWDWQLKLVFHLTCFVLFFPNSTSSLGPLGTPVRMCEYICCWRWCWVVQSEKWAQREGVRPTQTSTQPTDTLLFWCMFHLLKAWCLFTTSDRWVRTLHKEISADTSVFSEGTPNTPHTCKHGQGLDFGIKASHKPTV